MRYTKRPYIPEILEIIKTTWEGDKSKRVGSTDGKGTKPHWKYCTYEWAALDALAMNLNDLLMLRTFFGPYELSLMNHIMLPKERGDVFITIAKTLARECRSLKIEMICGDSAIHVKDMRDMEVSISIVGDRKSSAPENEFQIGDILIGIPSSGIHSNGWTFLEDLFRDDILGKQIPKEWFVPTRLYYEEFGLLATNPIVHGIQHITGDAFTKLWDCLPADADIHIRRRRPHCFPKEFDEIYKMGVDDKTMYEIFNCGFGMILSIAEKDFHAFNQLFPNPNTALYELGKVIEGTGEIRIESQFSDTVVTL